MRALALIPCFLLGSAAFAQSTVAQTNGNQDWRFAHPGATLIGSFRVKATLDSPLVNLLVAQASAKDPSTAAIVGIVRQVVGGVTEVRFSVRDMGKGKDPDVLALVTGVVDDNLAGSLAQGKTKTEIRRLDAKTLLLGEKPSLDEAVARMSKPATGLQARALDRAKALANHDLWIAGTLPELPMTLPVLNSLRGLALGISLQKDLNIEVSLDTDSAKTAEDLVSAARRSQVQQPGLGAALQSEADGSTARFRFSMPGDQVLQAVQQGMANGGATSPLAALFGPTPPAFRSSEPQPAAPERPKRDTIRIYGLDDGPREIKPEPHP